MHTAAERGEITLTINGDPREIPAESTVGELLALLGLDRRMVVVERNREILRDRAAFDALPVLENDVIEIVHFVGGG